jgi:hypothetical protein
MVLTLRSVAPAARLACVRAPRLAAARAALPQPAPLRRVARRTPPPPAACAASPAVAPAALPRPAVAAAAAAPASLWALAARAADDVPPLLALPADAAGGGGLDDTITSVLFTLAVLFLVILTGGVRCAQRKSAPP